MEELYKNYKETAIETASPKELIVMLYEKAIEHLEIAKNHMHYRTYDIVNNHIIKAQDIITELMLALDLEKGGEVAKNLFNIYAYMKKELLEGNMKKDKKILERVQKWLGELKSAWEKVEVESKEEEISSHPEGEKKRIALEG